MSKLALIRDLRFQKHETPAMHPESPERLAALDDILSKTALEHDLEEFSPRRAAEDEIALVHNSAYVEDLSVLAERAVEEDFVQVDPDTFMSEQTYEIAKLAAGAGLVAIDSVMKTQLDSAFVAVRPPGHHASIAKSKGFCFFNNIAIAARYAQQHYDRKRVMIIDWDVHHGNGTQDIFYDDPSVFFLSMHQYPFYPGNSGWISEDGAGEGKGKNMNIPLPAGTGDRGYAHVWDKLVEPVVLEYQPDLILVSAGYDAHQFDPLGQQRITTAGYARLSQKLLVLSQETRAKIVCFLEGGYNVQSLSESAVATMRVLNSENAKDAIASDALEMIPDLVTRPTQYTTDRNATLLDDRVRAVRKHMNKYWKSLRPEV